MAAEVQENNNSLVLFTQKIPWFQKVIAIAVASTLFLRNYVHIEIFLLNDYIPV